MHSNAVNETDAQVATSPRCAGTSWLLSGLLAFCFLCAFFHVSDVDVGYHIRTGEHILAGHGIPAQNTFSHSVPNDTWLIQQWMPATIYAWVHRLGGIAAMTTFKAVLAALAMFLVLCCARDMLERNSLWPFCVVTIAVLIVRVRFFERPDLFTTTLFALTLLLDQRFGSERRWQFIFLPLLMAFWANTHGGYIYGFVLLTALAAAEWFEYALQKWRETNAPRTKFKSLLVRPVGIALSLVAAVTSVQAINPSGWKTLLVPFMQFFSKLWQATIMEFQPPTWSNSKLLYLWMGALVILQIVTWRHFRMRYFVTSAVFAYFACSSQRSIPAFVIASVPYATHMLGKLPRIELTYSNRFPRLLLPVTWAALIAFIIVPDPTFQFGIGLYHPYYPSEIFRFVKQEVPPQNIFNDMRFGGPMLWTLYPDFKPFIDGRNDAYTEDFWKTEYLPAIQGEDSWPEIFEKYHITGALLSLPQPTKVPRLGTQLFAHPDWALVAFNDETLLFLKRTDANKSVIGRSSFKHLWPGNWNFGDINATNLANMAPEAARAWEMYPGVYAHAAAARCAMVSGDFANASKLLSVLVNQPEAGAGFWRDYAYCLYASKQHSQADRVLADMIRKKLEVGFACYLKHFIALENRRPEEAKALLAKALDLEPDNASFRQAWLRFQPNLSAESRRSP